MSAENQTTSAETFPGAIAPKRRQWTRSEILALVIILIAVGFARMWRLEADPPIRLSNSHDVYTDAALYTFYAKQFVQTGDFNPLGDERFGIFLKSTVTPVAVIVFKLFGVGLWQSNLVGVLFSLGALFCFYLFIRRIAGVMASLLFLLTAGLTYNLVFFGRQPFLEHAMAFWAFLSLAIVTYARRWWGFAIAGFCLGLAMLFSKIHGIIFLFPFACMFAWRLRFDDEYLDRLQPRQIVSYGGGVLAAAATWIFVTYLPAPAQVSSFFRENTIELHGAPEGLQSIPDFIEKLLTFGFDTNFFPRIVIIALVGFTFMAAVVYQLCRKQSYRSGFGWGNAGYVFILMMTLAFYLSLMIWNYRPLRYQLILLYPLAGGASILIAGLWQGWRSVVDEKTPVIFWILLAALAVIPGYQLLAGSQSMVGTDWWRMVSKYLVAISGIVSAGIVWLTFRLVRKLPPPRRPVLLRIVAVLILVGCLFQSLDAYLDWAVRPAFSIRDINRDIEMAVGPGTVVTGPYAQVLTLENKVSSLIHMFGTAHPDPELFKRFPITHLLLDDGNIARLSDDYPAVINAHEHICTYFAGETKVRLMDISLATGNPNAAAYRRTTLEQGIIAYRRGDTAYARLEARTFALAHPGSIAGGLLLFELSNEIGDFATAETALKKAVEFSPTSYVLKARLGRFYRDRARATGRRDLFELAGRYYEEAVHQAPTAERTVEEYQRFLESKE